MTLGDSNALEAVCKHVKGTVSADASCLTRWSETTRQCTCLTLLDELCALALERPDAIIKLQYHDTFGDGGVASHPESMCPTMKRGERLHVFVQVGPGTRWRLHVGPQHLVELPDCWSNVNQYLIHMREADLYRRQEGRGQLQQATLGDDDARFLAQARDVWVALMESGETHPMMQTALDAWTHKHVSGGSPPDCYIADDLGTPIAHDVYFP